MGDGDGDGDGRRRRETGTDGKFPFLETLNKHEPNQFCQISLRKRPVCPRFPPIPLSASGLPRRGSGGSDLTLNVRFSCL